MVFDDFLLTNRCKGIRIQIKNLIGLGYRFWVSFYRFCDPKLSKFDDHHWHKSFLETIWIQNDSKSSQGLEKYPQNDPQSSKNDPQNEPRAIKPRPKRPPELQTPLCSSHVAFCTLHFTLSTSFMSSIQPGGLREAIK